MDNIINGDIEITKRPKCTCGNDMILIRRVNSWTMDILTYWICDNYEECDINVDNLIPDIIDEA